MAPRVRIERILDEAGVEDRIVLVGVRGYYLRTIGHPERNDRAVYDDAAFFLTPTKFESYNFNTDPAGYRYGIATLDAGLWRYKQGIHGLSKPKDRQYMALVQAAPVTVTRDGKGKDTGFFGINIHRGGQESTSSEGCQTVRADQWEEFRRSVFGSMDAAGIYSIPYLLVDNTGQF